MRLMIFSGLTILLAGCATTTTNYYSSTINSWQGGKSNKLMSAWGQPDRRIEMRDGSSILIYKTTSYRTYSTTGSPAIGVNTSGPNPVLVTQPNTNNALESRTLSLDCFATFEVNKQGTIVKTQYTNHGCYAGHTFADRLANHH